MNSDAAKSSQVPPPRLIPAFVSGFNIVANHIYLILLPIILDLLLWFGPHLRVKSLFMPLITEAIRTVQETGTPQARDMLVGMEEIWKVFLERYNLLSSLSTFPLGLPAMMAQKPPLLTPMGNAPIVEVTSPLLVPLGWLFLTLAGLVLGSFYLSLLANCLHIKKDPSASFLPDLRMIMWQTFQLFGLILFIIILLAVILLPTMVISSLLVLISPALSWLVLLGMSFLAVWLMIPLIFTPHGIFTLRQNTIHAALNSATIVRYVLPGTGLFILISIVLYQGMGVLWHTPPETSWMALIGILGHAFIATAVLASSFVYYLQSFNWVQATRRVSVDPERASH